MRWSYVRLVTLALLAVACSKEQQSGKKPTWRKLGETTGLKTPESVRYDPDFDIYFISNINGNPAQKDNNGFIAVVNADSTGLAPKMLAEGGKNGVRLDAPKGMAIVGDTLWVADIDHVRAFSRKTGAPIADIDLAPQGAKFLNDVAVGPDSAVYVTDSGIAIDEKGTMTHPGTDQIFRITGRTGTSIKVDSLNTPNGITWDENAKRFVLAPMAGTAVQVWHPGDKVASTLANGPGQYDGVEVIYDGRILVTSWADSSLNVVNNGSFKRVIGGLSGPADIGVDTKRVIVAIPRLMDNKVEYYKIIR